MTWLNISTEYDFGATYGHIEQVVKASKFTFAGIADYCSTWGHIKWRKYCTANNIKPIYGVKFPVTENLQRDVRRYPFNIMTFVAITTEGLKTIYEIVDVAHQQFYYRPRLTYEQVNTLNPGHIALFSGVAPRFDLIEREMYLELTPATPDYLKKIQGFPIIAGCDNSYIFPEDKIVYESFADQRKLERKTSAQYIISWKEWWALYPDRKEGILNLIDLAEKCTAELSDAKMVKYYKKADIKKLCLAGAKKRKVNLKDPVYKVRYEREMKLIKDKGYIDYFLMVADVIKYAKTKMVVGPSRGSSAGSLVCYLMGITEVDPIPFGLYFERFIDINRFDLPDIDVDFQDNKRSLVIKYLERKYGKDNVAQIGNVNRLKPKSALTRFAKALNIPIDDVIEVKDAILERSGGDARAALCIEDTLNDTDVGRRFIEKYPNMKTVSKIESHASHAGVHAAGILVCNNPITKFCGINSRDGKRIAMLDKKDAEAINLLKIDALGLRTLTIFADVCDAVKKPYAWLYKIPLDDEAAYKVFNDQRLTGIFQFEGYVSRSLTKQMPINNMEDISALVAIARPGPVVSGGATTYIDARTGKKKVEYISAHPSVIEATKDTFGVVIYQEQVLNIGRNYGGLNWEDTSELRKAMSKSLGEEFFDKYKKRFLKGAVEKGETEEAATKVWKYINTFGSWGMNKAHTISYSIISYLCAYLKAHHPMEFAVACLNHAKDDPTALKLLRDLCETEGIQYVPFSVKLSEAKWSVKRKKLYGGLTTIHGIGPANANKIIKLRKEKKPFPPGIQKKLDEGITPFEFLYPATEKYGEYYNDPKKFGLKGKVETISKVTKNGKYTIIGCMVHKNLRDANEIVNVAKRGGGYLDGPTSWLNLTLEDDTDNIICTIGRFDYERMGIEIAETGKENKDWYMVYGQMKNNWRKLYVINIRRITK
jgi:DNA polymerase III alpha subunit